MNMIERLTSVFKRFFSAAQTTEIIDLNSEVKKFVNVTFQSKDSSQLIKELLSDVKDLSTTVNVCGKIYIRYTQYKFKTYVTVFYDVVQHGKKDASLTNEKLENLLKNEENIQFIAQSIENVFNTQSVECIKILAFFTGGIISHQHVVEYRDRIILAALKIMTDDDLNNFMELYSYVKSHPELLKDTKANEMRLYDMKSDISTLNVTPIELESSIQKLKSVQAVGCGIGGWGRIGDGWGVFVFNEYSDYLYEITVKCQTFLSQHKSNP
jgi:hypothetical protein